MTNPQFMEEKPLSLADVRSILEKVQERDKELNFRAAKVNEYVGAFTKTSSATRDQLQKSLEKLDLVRLKQEHIMKIIDFLPTTTNELKTVLQAYPLSMPKKDQEAIVEAVKAVIRD